MYLRHLETYSKNLDEKISTAKAEIQTKERRAERLMGDSEDTKKMLIERISDVEKNLESMKKVLESKNQNKESLREAIKQRSTMDRSESKKLNDVQSKVEILSIDVENLKTIYYDKQHHLDRLKKIIKEIDDTKASIETGVQSGQISDRDMDIKLEIIDELTRKCVTIKRDLKKTGFK